ncbi:hypothetical protein M8J75_015275 [Diaphorina citri]|nr:hypothetical protein M8J75_015275 [Diaphorina citri]
MNIQETDQHQVWKSKISEVGAQEPGAPVLVGYSLVGVYPCAVWKPREASSTGPIRTTSGRLASSVRAAPYPQPVYPGVEACRCARGPEDTPCHESAPVVNGNNASGTPMLFVPFSVPSNYTSHLTPAPAPGSNSISPSGGTTPITAKWGKQTKHISLLTTSTTTTTSWQSPLPRPTSMLSDNGL